MRSTELITNNIRKRKLMRVDLKTGTLVKKAAKTCGPLLVGTNTKSLKWKRLIKDDNIQRFLHLNIFINFLIVYVVYVSL